MENVVWPRFPLARSSICTKEHVVEAYAGSSLMQPTSLTARRSASLRRRIHFKA
ncbi:hypothetical protein LEMLEM_LOCUS25398 [Lemmus lemmus]